MLKGWRKIRRAIGIEEDIKGIKTLINMKMPRVLVE